MWPRSPDGDTNIRPVTPALLLHLVECVKAIYQPAEEQHIGNTATSTTTGKTSSITTTDKKKQNRKNEENKDKKKNQEEEEEEEEEEERTQEHALRVELAGFLPQLWGTPNKDWWLVSRGAKKGGVQFDYPFRTREKGNKETNCPYLLILFHA